MLTVTLICIGKLKEKYLRDACAEYQKRLGAFCKLNILELSEFRLPDNPSESEIQRCIEKEGASILAKLPKDSFVIPLCIEGKPYSSPDLAKEFQKISVSGQSGITFIIGGSYGLSEEVKSLGKIRLSMSEMTFPHQRARVMLLEQVYRCFQINSNGKYHK